MQSLLSNMVLDIAQTHILNASGIQIRRELFQIRRQLISEDGLRCRYEYRWTKALSEDDYCKSHIRIGWW